MSVLAKLKHSLRSAGSSSSSTSSAASAKQARFSQATVENSDQAEREIFDEPLAPDYMLQSQQEKERQQQVQVGRGSSGHSPQFKRREGGSTVADNSSSVGSSAGGKGAKVTANSLDVATPAFGGESSLDSPNVTRSRTLPAGQIANGSPSSSPGMPPVSVGGGGGSAPSHHQHHLHPFHPTSSSSQDARGDAMAEGSSPSAHMKKRHLRDLRTLPAGAPSEAPCQASRGGIEDDYVDPFDAKLQAAAVRRNTSPPLSGSRPRTGPSSGTHPEASDTYEDPFDVKHKLSKPGGGVRKPTSAAASSSSDTYESPFDTRRSASQLHHSHQHPAVGRVDSHPAGALGRRSPSDALYQMPLEAKTSHQLHGVRGKAAAGGGDDDNYMDPFDAKSNRKTSPLPSRRVSKPRIMDVSKLPPTTSESGDYCDPFELKNGLSGSLAGHGRSPRPATHDPHPVHRTISVPEVLIDTEDTCGNYVLPHDTVLRQSRGQGASPAVYRTPSSERPPHLDRSGPGSATVSRSSSGRSVHSDIEGFPVDVDLPLDEQPWYHGALRREDAEKRLTGAKDGSFIIRQSESCLTDFSMSLRNHHETMHLKIHQRPKDSRYVLGLNSRPFKSIQAMILYYTKNHLPIRGAEHISLVNGIARASSIYANVLF